MVNHRMVKVNRVVNQQIINDALKNFI